MQCNCGDAPFNFDLERMTEALKGPSYRMPDNINGVEEIREWLHEVANNTDEENEKYIVKE